MFKNYNMNQQVLPLDLEIRLQENDIAFAVHHLVESIPDDAFEPFTRTTGCPAYHTRMMMKIILCAYTQSVFSGRKIEGLLQDSLRMMWLDQGNEPSYRTINRFRVHPAVTPILKQAFVTFRCHLVEMGEIKEEAIFIDGTKLEANANRYTFVWRKSVERYSASLVEKSNLLKEVCRPKGDVRWTEQLFEDGYGCDVYVDEGRSYAKWTTQARVQLADCDRRSIYPRL